MVARAGSDLWPWLADQARQLASDAGAELDGPLPPSLAELERRITALHPALTWEIGPHAAGVYLALSPGGDPALFALTQALVAHAAAPPGWVILPAKPAKSWNRSLELGGVNIDASSWQVQLTPSADGRHELRLGLPEDYGLSTERLHQVARIVLESELGEDRVLERIAHIELTLLADWPSGVRPRPFYELWSALESLGD